MSGISGGVLGIAKAIKCGLEENRPAGSANENIYFATDTKKLWAYDGSAWQDCKVAVEVATLLDFQTPEATGTAINPTFINNNDTGTAAVFNDVGDIVEVDFGKTVVISAYRYYGYNSHVGDGRYVLQYWDGSAWVNHVIDIPTRAGSWSNFIPFRAVATDKVRIVAPVLDTFDNSNHAYEWEIVGDVLPKLTVTDFRANAATGTMISVERFNDGATTLATNGDVVGKYAEVVFGKMFEVKEFRQWGDTNNVGDGEWKIQYWNGISWVDLNTGIPARPTADWSDWTSLTATVNTTKIRWLVTVLDSKGWNAVNEVEMRG